MKHDFIDENAREQLSALLDGELDNEDSARFLQRRLQHDDALVGQLVRWQLAGDILRANVRSEGASDSEGTSDLATRVRAAIEREQTRATEKPKARRGWMLWGSGLAAAAALGFAALNLPGATDPVPAVKEVATVSNVPIAAKSSTVAVISTPTKTPAKQAVAVTEIPEPVQHRVADVAPRHRQREVVADVARRMRDPSQDAAPVAPERAVAVATATPVKSKVNRNPFTMQAAAPQPEPAWPKAVLPGFNSGLNAGFRSDGNAGNPFAPHRNQEEVTTP